MIQYKYIQKIYGKLSGTSKKVKETYVTHSGISESMLQYYGKVSGNSEEAKHYFNIPLETPESLSHNYSSKAEKIYIQTLEISYQSIKNNSQSFNYSFNF